MRPAANLARFFSTHPLTRDARIKAWGRFLAWQIKSRLADEVLVPWVNGQTLAVRRGMVGATGNIYAGLHEFEDMMMVLHFLRAGDLFLDIGANVGSYAVLASGVCRARTWAFEPDPDAARNLKRNLTVNSLQDLVTVYEVALGSESSAVPFTIGLKTTNRVAENYNDKVRMVPLRRLDDVIGSEAPVMLKMDVEGYEENVLRGAIRLLQCPSLKVVELETVTPGTEKLMLRHSFERAHYDPFHRQLAKGSSTSGAAFNALYVRDWPLVGKRLMAARKCCILQHWI